MVSPPCLCGHGTSHVNLGFYLGRGRGMMRDLGAKIATGIALLFATHSTYSADRRQMPPRDTADAAVVMGQLIAAYRSLSSYSDKGTSITRNKDGTYNKRVDFETLFKRPGKLRFAWSASYDHIDAPGTRSNLIRCDGTTAWASYAPTKTCRGSRSTLPSLLREEQVSLQLPCIQSLGC